MGEPTGRQVFCSYRAHFGNNAPSSDFNRPFALQIIQKKCAPSRCFASRFGLLLSLGVLLTACGKTAETDILATEPAPDADVAEEEPILQCGNDGELHAELYGALTARLEWNKNDLQCAGMPRPEGRGARLRFAGTVNSDERPIAIIIAIPDLERAARGNEFKSNITIIEEGNGRFFSTQDLDNCLTDITALEALDDSGDRYSIGGILYCVSPLPEINGQSSILIPELHFSGLIDWSSS
jgi:hypothetical protein